MGCRWTHSDPMRHQPDNVYLFPHSRPALTATLVTADLTVAAPPPPPSALPQLPHRPQRTAPPSPLYPLSHRWDDVRRLINFKHHQHPHRQPCGLGS
ncbi:hypothetical protein SprV_0602172000 [Sparganum proliferum]